MVRDEWSLYDTFQPIQGEFCENLLRDAVNAVHFEGKSRGVQGLLVMNLASRRLV